MTMREDDGEPDPRLVRYITVSGVGRKAIAPDIVEITVGVWTESTDSRRGVEINSRKVTKLFQTLADAGIPKRDLRTSGFVVQPKYHNRSKSAYRIVGYSIANNVTVTVRKIEDVSTILGLALRMGATVTYGPHFRVGNPSRIEDVCRKLAVSDARRKAELMAAALGARVGPPRSVSEGDAQRGRSDLWFASANRDSLESASHAPPIAEGEQQVEVRVSVVFDLIVDPPTQG